MCPIYLKAIHFKVHIRDIILNKNDPKKDTSVLFLTIGIFYVKSVPQNVWLFIKM